MLRFFAILIVAATALSATAASAGALKSMSDLVTLEQQLPPQPAPAGFTLTVPIIVYHSVRPFIPHESALQDQFDITPELLESQLRYLNEHHIKTITPQELVRQLKSGQATTTAQVILTFDDGWENQYRYAYPLLAKYHATAVFYVFTNPLSRARHYLTWDQVRELHAAGFTIGSHTLTHPYLSRLTDAELDHQLTESKKIIEDELAAPVTDFASPFGYSDARVQAAAARAGYTTARTLYLGRLQSTDSALHMPAYLVNDSLPYFEKLVSN